MLRLPAHRSISETAHQFWLDRLPGPRPDDGWFEVSWHPNWTGADGDQAKLRRRHLRGSWIRVSVKGHGRAAIFRRLSFARLSSEAAGRPAGVAVRLSWDDQISLLNDGELLADGVPIELELSSIRWWDWIRIIGRRPLQNAEGTIVGLVGVVLGLLGTALGLLGIALALGSPTRLTPDRSGIDSSLPVGIQIGVLGRDKADLIVRRSEGSAGSAGLIVECNADPSQCLAVRVDGASDSGRWTLRVDDGHSKPLWLPLQSFSAVRVTGSDNYRFFIYSDDGGASISINDLSVRLAKETDLDLPLVWPAEGPLAEAERSAFQSEWEKLLGFSSADTTIAKAKAITDFVYQRSNVTRASSPMDFGNPRPWFGATARTIDGLCGRFGEAVVELCSKFGVVARLVALGTKQFWEGGRSGDTHVLAEVFDAEDQRWILFDPTFNVMFVGSDGQMMGLSELLAAQSQGVPWRIVPIGSLREGRTVDAYYLQYGELLFMGSAPAVAALGELGREYRSHAQTVSEVAREKYSP